MTMLQADAQLYYRERGGDAAACVVAGVPGLEEVKLTYDQPGAASTASSGSSATRMKGEANRPAAMHLKGWRGLG